MSTPVASPAPVWDVINGYTAYGALVAALDLALFDAVGAGAEAADLATRIGAADPEPVALLADTLVSLGFLGSDGVSYRLTPVAERYLLAGSPHDMSALVRLSPGPTAAWAQLAATVRAGAADTRVDDDPGAFYPALVAATAPTQRTVAAAAVADLDRRGWLPRAATVVDLGAGSGAWVAAALAARPQAHGVAVDLPEVVGTTARLAADVGDRLEIVSGDYLAVDLPAAADLVVLGHVLRAEPPARARTLLHRAIALAGDAGTVLVADYPRPDPVTAPDPDHDARLVAARHELLLSLTMLAATPGRGISEATLREWAAQAGAAVVARLEPLPRQTVFVIRPIAPAASAIPAIPATSATSATPATTAIPTTSQDPTGKEHAV